MLNMVYYRFSIMLNMVYYRFSNYCEHSREGADSKWNTSFTCCSGPPSIHIPVID